VLFLQDSSIVDLADIRAEVFPLRPEVFPLKKIAMNEESPLGDEKAAGE
jgi:hypothetical protein